MSSYLLKTAAILLMLIGALELVLRSKWTTWYFQRGILLVTRKIRVDFHHTNIPSSSTLEKKFRPRWLDLTTPLLFREVEPNVYAFRANWWSRSLRVLHGVVIFDLENSQVVVKGFFDWSLFWLWPIPPLAWLLGGSDVSMLLYFGIVLVMVGASSWDDTVRCSAIAEFAAQSWSRNYFPIGDRG